MEEFNGETFYTAEECAEYLGKTVDEVRELIRSGEMHAYKLKAIRCPWMAQKNAAGVPEMGREGNNFRRNSQRILGNYQRGF